MHSRRANAVRLFFAAATAGGMPLPRSKGSAHFFHELVIASVVYAHFAQIRDGAGEILQKPGVLLMAGMATYAQIARGFGGDVVPRKRAKNLLHGKRVVLCDGAGQGIWELVSGRRNSTSDEKFFVNYREANWNRVFAEGEVVKQQ